MSGRWTALLAARARVEAADRRIADNVATLTARLSPERIVADASRSARAKADKVVVHARTAAIDGARLVTDNPVRSAIAVTGIVALLARHRIAAAVTRLINSGSTDERTSNGR